MSRKSKRFRITYQNKEQKVYKTLQSLHEDNKQYIKITLGALYNALNYSKGLWRNNYVTIERLYVLTVIKDSNNNYVEV